MTGLGTTLVALLAAGAVATGGLLDSGSSGPPIALVIDAAEARDGRELFDTRLRELDADVRLPRTDAEARTNVRYFSSLGYRVVVAGPRARAAADAAGVGAVAAADLAGALAAVAERRH